MFKSEKKGNVSHMVKGVKETSQLGRRFFYASETYVTIDQ